MVLVDTAAVHAAALQLEQEWRAAEARAEAQAEAQHRAANPPAAQAAAPAAERVQVEKKATGKEQGDVEGDGSEEEGWEEVLQEGADGPAQQLGGSLEDVEEGDEAAAEPEPAQQSSTAGKVA